ncbi:acyltransferase family protein [Pseudomonas marincola]|uniref:acyltransferase family protein n=1 Tax=Pseudomonas marincola TaxID=437900 RepID=UPI0008E2CA14|nr:hypothetical protein [Pseudomonas marincola]SFT76604.1 hypothetical protein SAMN05216264_1049 [Pseudomonas marincola]
MYAALVFTFIMVIYFWCWKGAEAFVIYGTDVRQIFITGIYFLIGTCFAKWKLERLFTLSGVCVLIMLTVLIAPYELFAKYILWFTLPYIVLAYGLSTSKMGSLVNRVGDCSYGVYIYAFPVQQFVLLVYPEISYVSYLLVTLLITLFLGYCSWHLIEKHALKLKPKDKRVINFDVPNISSSNAVVEGSTNLPRSTL